MFKNYLILAFRNLRKQKGYAIINIAGLSLGMACCILIVGFIMTELSYDRYHEKADQIYRLISKLTLGETPNMIATTNGPPALAMRDEYPEVLEAARVLPRSRISVRHDEKEFYEDGTFYADASIFNIFSFPLMRGSPESALSAAYSVVLTEEMAFKYFGGQEPIGKILRLNAEHDYTVTGVVKNVPANSHFVFDLLVSFETLNAQNRQRHESWQSSFIYHSYILLDKNSDYKLLEKKLPALVDKHIGDSFERFGASVEYFLQPVTSIHLHSKLRHEISAHSDINYVYTFGLVAAFVLLIACFNFINLATARSASRAKEVGMRKVLGADRKRLIGQFLGESMVYSFLSFIMALVFVQLALPTFRSMSDRPLSFDFAEIPWLILGITLLPLVVGFFAGAYPAFFLASFQPVRILKSSSKAGVGNSLFRKILVVSQFVISIALIICTGIVFNQLQYMKNKNLGFDQKQIVVVPVADNNIRQSLEEIKQELTRNPAIISVAASSHVPGSRPSGGSYQPEGYADGQTVMMDGMSMDHDYIPTLGMQLVSGRNFSQQHASDPENSIMINETAAKEIGWEDPIGKIIRRPGQSEGKVIVGVVKDFHYQAPQKPIRPLYISNGMNPRTYRTILFKINPDNVPGTIDFLTNKWQEFDPNRALDYSFLDASFDQQYRTEQRLSEIFMYFTAFSIFIACLGLYGMSSYTAEQRTKEIGIRKVLGASIPGILLRISREYIGTILLSFMIAIPIAYFAMNRWLQDFAFRVEIRPGVFLVAGALSLLIAVLTVSYQSVRAAMKNPVQTLRYEES